uniref:Insulinase family protein n=1 Tax=candidate division WOR-3 bacterium TaxID=2052148 RepID=A0A7C4YA57_UNCW3
MNNVFIEELPCGSVLIFEEDKRVSTVDISFLVKTGSIDEEPSINGIAHFIEHLLFKGTKKRTNREISEEIELKGGSIDAFTSTEYTCFYTHLLSEDYLTGIDLLQDLIFNPAFREEDFENEKKVIIQEVKSYFDSPENLLIKYHSERLFGKENPISFPIEGTIKSVSSLKLEQLKRYWEKFYTPDNIIITCIGNIKYDDIKKSLSIPQMNERIKRERTFKEIRRDKKNLKCIYKNSLEQVYVAISNTGFPYNDKRRYTLLILMSILGQGMSSYLFMKMREENALVYTIFTYVNQFQNTGEYGIFLATDEKNINNTLFTLKDALKNFNVDEELLIKTKTKISKGYKLEFQNTGRRAGWYQREFFYTGNIISMDEFIKNINDVKIKDVMDLYEEFFDTNKFMITTLGRVRNVKW